MTAEEFKSLSEIEQKEEIEKCKSSLEYFYNNYCKKEGMPDFSQESWEEYVENNKKLRFSRRRTFYPNQLYPFTPEEAFKL